MEILDCRGYVCLLNGARRQYELFSTFFHCAASVDSILPGSTSTLSMVRPRRGIVSTSRGRFA
jgi:hypothetical protein